MSGFRTEQTLFDAAIESARIFNGVAAGCAVSSGLLDALDEFATPEEVLRRCRFEPSKSEAFAALMNVLADSALVERITTSGGAYAYRRHRNLPAGGIRDGELARYTPQLDILKPWYGQGHADLIHASNLELLGDDLSFFRSASVRIRFDASFLDAWRTNLSNPLYEFGRLVVVQEMIARGRRFLDLAGGLGYGAQRLAELSPQGCEVLVVDKSTDFLSEARQLLYPGSRVNFAARDLNEGLPPLPAGYFDGVLCNGAFHFIHDKAQRLREIHRVLRPGGVLVIGHCFCRSGFADESMHDLYFSLLADASWPISFATLRRLLADHGFAELKQLHRGSHSYIIAERLAGTLEAPRP